MRANNRVPQKLRIMSNGVYHWVYQWEDCGTIFQMDCEGGLMRHRNTGEDWTRWH